jgi:MFS family permease
MRFRFNRSWRPAPIPRAEGVSDRAVRLGLLGRFTDELFAGLPDVLMPSIRARLGFSYGQVGLAWTVLFYVAAIVEPIAGLLLDVWRRHRLFAWGALGCGVALVAIGVAPSYVVLLAGFALYGAASGPLAHTADVVLVEAHPEAPGRIYARATLLDTTGALLGPLLVAIGPWAGVDWRWILVGVGLWGPIYALLLLRTAFPLPRGTHDGTPLLVAFRRNLASALGSRSAVLWLAFLFAEEVVEAPLTLRAVWLADDVGMGQGLIGVYVAFELLAALLAVAYLDRWLVRGSPRRILGTGVLALLVLYPAWFAVPGALSKFAIGAPLGFFHALLWPVAQGELLSSVPGRAGALTALRSTFSLVPLPLIVGLAAEAQGLGVTMASMHVLGVVAMGVVLLRLPPSSREPRAA